MKPLSEWTDAELRGRFLDAAIDTMMAAVPAADVLSELLRRERLKVAAEMRGKAKAVALDVAFECGDDGSDGWRGQVAARDIAERIGRLK